MFPKKKLWYIEAMTGCSCCAYENFDQGFYDNPDEPQAIIDKWSKGINNPLASQYARYGRYYLREAEAEILPATAFGRRSGKRLAQRYRGNARHYGICCCLRICQHHYDIGYPARIAAAFPPCGQAAQYGWRFDQRMPCCTPYPFPGYSRCTNPKHNQHPARCRDLCVCRLCMCQGSPKPCYDCHEAARGGH